MSGVRSMLWCDRIDGEAFVACCCFREVHRGTIYGASTFLLLGTDEPLHYRWKARVEQKLKDELVKGVHCDGFRLTNRYGMPIIGWIRDLNRA